MNKTQINSLDVLGWVDYIQTLHAREIELGLDRVREVFVRLVPEGVGFTVIGVAGTNGKGSTSELLRSVYHEAGYRVGKYTSPHILSFNERINIDGYPVSDGDLLGAFKAVEIARQTTRLTYFEYATLVAIELFTQADVDVAIMEVGLGGRLDATNILDADLAIVTSISLDHTAWLGGTVEEIGREKIAIAGAGKHCVLGMSQPTNSILDYCVQHNIEPYIFGQHFSAKVIVQDIGVDSSIAPTWSWHGDEHQLLGLSLPFQQQGHQLNNAATVIQSLMLLQTRLPVTDLAIRDGIEKAVNQGRCQLVSSQPWLILDVAHNVDAVKGLRRFVNALPIKGKVYAVCGMLGDKQVSEILECLQSTVDEWHFATIETERGLKAEFLVDALRSLYSAKQGNNRRPDTVPPSNCYSNALKAYRQVGSMLTNDDCLIVFGSFFMVSDIIAEI